MSIKIWSLICCSWLVGVFTISQSARAATEIYSPQATPSPAIKDSDLDGLSDEAEVSRYGTNPLKADSDGDTFFDGQEVIANSDPTDTQSTPLTVEENRLKNNLPLPWYMARVGGILAFVLFSLGVVFGLSISSKSAYRFLRPPAALEVHMFINTLAFLALALHIVSLLFDSYIVLKPHEIFIPFMVAPRSFKSILGYDFNAVIALGIVSFYFIVILLLTSIYRAKISIKLWRKIHYLSFFTYLLFLVHGYLTGSDSKEIWMETIYRVSLISVLTMTSVRLLSVLKRLHNKPSVSPQGGEPVVTKNQN